MTDSILMEQKNLRATGKALHRAVEFFESQNAQAYEQALAVAVCEPDKFNKDKQYAEAFDAKEAYETVIAETEDLKQSANALAKIALGSGLHTVSVELEKLVRLCLQVSYAPISNAGFQARAAADSAIDAACRLARRLE